MIKVLTFAFIFSFIEKILTEEQNKIYKCGVDHSKIKPPFFGNEIPYNYSSPLYRRRLKDLGSDGFKKFNIYLDFENLKEEMKIYNLQKYQDTILNSMKKAANTLMSLLRVKPSLNDYWISDSNLTRFNINHWEKEKFGNEAHSKNISLHSLGIDLVIFSRFEYFEATIATAAAIYIDRSNYQPYCGEVNINYNIDYSKKGIEEYLTSVLIHEITHILGFSSYFFNYFNFSFTRMDKYGIQRFYLNSSKVIKVAKQYFNCSDIDGVELENDEGTTNSHWESRILLGEYMCGYIRIEEEVISEFTLAYLEDTGYYKANYYTGGLMRYGKNKGCSFLKDKCVNNYEINSKFENEFFDSTSYGIDPSCSSGRLGRAYNFFSTYKNLTTNYQYFKYKEYGGYRPADYCPVPSQFSIEQKINYYSGRCSKLGDGTYGSYIDYWEKRKEGEEGEIKRFYNNSILEKITGEKYSDHSFCYLSSLIKTTEEKCNIFTQKPRAVCFESFCSSKSLTIKIHENYIVCPRAGGKIELDEYGGYLLCPDYNLICTGTILCNNMFDCVDKKSKIQKDTYNYDYSIKTSQNIEKANIEYADNETNYELSEDGKCPLNCKQCLENKKCIKCRDDFEFVGINNEEQRLCIKRDELKVGYYINDFIYYKCMDFCEKCENDISCDKCIDNYDYLNNSCVFPFKKITIILLQVKLKDHQLYLYLLLDSYTPNYFSLTIKINIFIPKSLRNLQEESKKEMEIDISPLNYTKSNSYGGLYVFTPDNSFKSNLISEGEETRIVVTNIISIKTNNNKKEYCVEMGNNSDYLDTAKMEEKLQNRQAIDLSLIKNISIYHLESISQGCTFEIFTYETIIVSNREINLECQEINSHKNKSIACSIDKKNSRRILCNLEENINSNCKLKNYLAFSNNKLFSIILNEQNIIPISCSIENNISRITSSSSRLSKTLIILIILISIILAVIVVSFILFYRKYKNNKIINSNRSKIETSNVTTTNILD